MSNLAKYNTYKGVSTALTFGTPIVTLFSCGEFIKHRSETAISAAGIFVIILVLLFAKDKLFEYFKAPSALIVSLATLMLILLVENIMLPMKVVCITTAIACGLDEITFKQLYKSAKLTLPECADAFQKVGFIWTTNKKLEEANKCQTAKESN